MFKAKPRFKDNREWIKDNSLDLQFEALSTDYDVYVLKHHFYCMATAPMIKTFYSKGDLKNYLEKFTSAGDFLEVWGFILDSDLFAPFLSAKMPNKNGKIPVKGAY
jgi:hypothetical protein